MMRDICAREGIAPNQVVLHSDNGSPMKGATMLAMLQELAWNLQKKRKITQQIL